VIDFLFVTIEYYCYLLQLRHYKQKSVKVSIFQRGRVTLRTNFRWMETSPTNHCWSQKTSDCPFVWCQNIHSALVGFVTKHECDRRTDRQTDRVTTAAHAV